RRQARGARKDGLRLVVERAHRVGPGDDLLVGGVRLLEGMHIPQQMSPAALMLPAIGIVSTREVRAQVSVEVPEQLRRYLPGAAGVIVVVADGLRPRRRQAPDVAVLAVFPPARLVQVRERTGPCLRQQGG